MDSEPNQTSAKSDVETLYDQALKHHEAGSLTEAANAYARVLRLRPLLPEVHNNFGVVLRALGRPHAAIACYRRSLAIRPNVAGVLTNLGNAFRDLGLTDQSLQAHKRALALVPGSPNALFNAALAHRDKGDIKTALSYLKETTEKNPNHPDARFEMGLTLLVSGEWKDGFNALDIRLKRPGMDPRRPDMPMWGGEAISGKTILIIGEGNAGTIILLARYAAVLKKLGARVMFEAPKSVEKLLRLVPDIDAVIEPGEPVYGIDLQVPLLSIPARLGTTVRTVPNRVPYLTAPAVPPRDLNVEPTCRLAVGISWTGKGPDGQKTPLRETPCTLEDLLELAAVPGARLFSLEREGEAEIRALGVEVLVENAATGLDDLAALAGVIEQLDLVITTESPIAHLAAALGKPVWLMAGPGGEWCWLLERDDSPWYPNMQIFRKTGTEKWPDVTSRVRLALAEVLKG